ncbi:RNA polymerase sigma factor SigA [Frankliniella fusca]|uniref:RNA polymerase sigma factor SigA n=1 Tax=Frankliniella fusca TaxID=407009 RepID=A0AAE1LFK0_9NEOP|nr:RNA polymerase sigma factor SigA [Frankliniella fusca]
MQEKYNTDDSFKISHNTNVKHKYRTDINYLYKVLSNVKNSYQSLQGSIRKLNYANLYHASKNTKKFFTRELRSTLFFFFKSTVNGVTLKIDKSLGILDVCIYRSHVLQNESGNVCSTCANHLKKGKIPHFAVNGSPFELLPEELTGLTTLKERLAITKQLGLKGNCVNVPIDINKTVTCLPRMDSEDNTLLVQLMGRMSDKTPYAFENVRPEKVFNAAKYLVNTPPYKQHKISLNENWLQQFHNQTSDAITDSVSSINKDNTIEQADDEDDWTDQQETLLNSSFEADSGIKIATDEDMYVLAFPTVNGGKQRIFKAKYTPVAIAKAEARSHDRRVATNTPKVMMNFCKARIHILKKTGTGIKMDLSILMKWIMTSSE